MIQSMTGFGRCEASDENKKITVELKSVNHRYLDANIRMPRKLNPFEGKIRGILKEYMERGKVDLYISCEDESDGGVSLKYSAALAEEYFRCLKEISDQFGLENDTMADAPEDEDELWAVLEEALRGALERFTESRAKEGGHLKDDLIEKLDGMERYVADIDARYPQILTEYRSKLEAKVRELLADAQMDDARIAQEVTIFADKICVDEETVRLRSHIGTMKDALLKGGRIGRKLDFIAQEMNREANTILSKSNDIRTSDIGIALKTDIEKIREQIQNIE